MDIYARNYVEWRLMRYKQDKQNLRDWDELPSSCYGVHAPNRPYTQSGRSRPLEDLAVKRVSDRYIRDTEWTLSCIDFVLMRLQPEDRKLIKLVYIDKTHNMDGAALECNMSRRTAFRHSKAILLSIACELGIENRE